MMETDILKKENEFYQENEKLEQKTKELLRKVNDVMVRNYNFYMNAMWEVVCHEFYAPNWGFTSLCKEN